MFEELFFFTTICTIYIYSNFLSQALDISFKNAQNLFFNVSVCKTFVEFEKIMKMSSKVG